MTLAARVFYPSFIERDTDQPTTLEVFTDANPAVITAATYTLIKEDGTKAVDAQAATIAGGVLSYALTAAVLPTTDGYSRRWREQWTVTIGGVDSVLRRDAQLVPLRLYPVVTQTDVFRKHIELQHHYPEGRSNWQHSIDEAWVEIIGRLVSSAVSPSAIISPWSLRGPHLLLTLCNIITEMSLYDQQGRYTVLAEEYCKRFEESWAALKYDYDLDNDGDADVKEAVGSPILAHAGPAAPSFGRTTFRKY